MIGGRTVQYCEEPLEPVWDEWYALARKHWGETEQYLGEAPSPRKDMYLRYNELGMFHMFTVRNAEGELVGYAGFYVTPSMHTGRLIAKEDFWYVAPEYRKGFMVIRFLRFVEARLKEKGAERCMMSTKLSSGAGKILIYMGYTHISNVHVKRL